MSLIFGLEMVCVICRVADPYFFFAYPDPAGSKYMDPDPDPAPLKIDQNDNILFQNADPDRHLHKKCGSRCGSGQKTVHFQ